MKHFTWGDTVKVRINAEKRYLPGSVAEVCGVREVENQEQESEFEAKIGEKLYLVEFSNGSSIEVPEKWLEKIEIPSK